MQSSMLTGALSMYDNALKKVSLIDFISEDKAKALDAGMNENAILRAYSQDGILFVAGSRCLI